ncbi:MAG: hypothetical protein HFE90_07235 [Firmicutes bacterium]|nr:hypothetical protein [Bacillota bacterium]
MNNMLKKFTGIFLIAVLLLSAAACGGAADPEAEVASVNDVNITQRDADSFSVLYMYMLGYDPSELTRKEKQDILEDMVDTEIIRQHYESLEESVYSANYDTDLASFMANAKSSEEDFIAQYEITDEDLTNFYRSQYLTQIFFAEIQAANNEQDMYARASEYYEDNKKDYKVDDEVRISVILTETEEKANEVKTKIAEGVDFAALAEEYSIETNSASSGGDLGFFTKKEISDEYTESVFQLGAGEVSEPIKTDDGYVIVKVTDRNETGYKPLEEVLQDIYYILYEKLYDEKVETLKKDMEVKIGKVK